MHIKNADVISDSLVKTIYSNVFRSSTRQQGYYYLNLGSKLDSKDFRRLMVYIKEGLSHLCRENLNKDLHYQSLGRFNHQSTSEPHRDTADDHSFLMLGYEPTEIESKAYITDYSKFIEDKGVSIGSFFEEDTETNLILNNSILENYKIEIKPFNKEDYRILIANNSRSFKEATFGVFHSAEIPEKVKSQDRIINYVMLRLSGLNVKESYTFDNIQEFVSTENVNR